MRSKANRKLKPVVGEAEPSAIESLSRTAIRDRKSKIGMVAPNVLARADRVIR